MFSSIFVLLSAWISLAVIQGDELCAMYDLSTDPYESTNVCNNDDDTYVSYVSQFESLRSSWSINAISENLIDVPLMNTSWAECGRVCPFIESGYDPLSIDQIYTNKKAPHIVFILVDDWGYNDFGLRSTYLSWTTPTLDRLANEGILLDNYYTNEVCAPSRATFMTGRYPPRLGVYSNYAELPLSETTLAQELKSAGYRNYVIGKWHLGLSSKEQYPLQRGFDYFYGFVNGYSAYWSKFAPTYDKSYLDLFEDNDYVTNTDELAHDYHAGYLFQKKAEGIIKQHAEEYEDTPMFLYYAMQLIHAPWTAPEEYLSRCNRSFSSYHMDDEYTIDNLQDHFDNYCGLNLMMDEAIANLTCTLERYGFAENTLMIITGDNGGEHTIVGNNVPFRGSKGSLLRGGVSNTAIVHSKLIPESRRGIVFSKPVYIADWLPTIMHVATDNSWTSSYTNANIDGLDIWHNLINDAAVDTLFDRTIIFSSVDDQFVAQIGNMKYMYNAAPATADVVVYSYDHDLSPDNSRMICSNASLVNILEDSEVIYSHQSYRFYRYNGLIVIRTLVVCLFVITFGIATKRILYALVFPYRDGYRNESHQRSRARMSPNIPMPRKEPGDYISFHAVEAEESSALLSSS